MIFNNIDSSKTPVKCNGTVKNGEMSSIAARTPNGLAGLFAGGMPKLKPTGLAIAGTIIFSYRLEMKKLTFNRLLKTVSTECKYCF